MRVFAISDLHTDFKENWTLIRQLSDRVYRDDALIVAGDIADRIEIIQGTLAMLGSKFRQVFYVPGNHEMWVRSEGYDSIEKLSKILDVCDSLGVRTRPAKISGLWIVPLFSWYNPDFDSDDGNQDEDLERWADFYFCKWPDGIGQASEYFFKMNEPHIKRYDGPVISFSHFLPKRDLLPSKEYLRFKALPKVAGSKQLDDQVRRLNPVIHIFGHSHINLDRVIDGVRYIQNALAYPRERRSSTAPVKQVWDSDAET